MKKFTYILLAAAAVVSEVVSKGLRGDGDGVAPVAVDTFVTFNLQLNIIGSVFTKAGPLIRIFIK